MTDSEKVPMNNNKLAMSRALGAAFLSHQVEQLEKTAASNSHNWRERRHSNPSSPHPHVERNVTPTNVRGGRGGRAGKRGVQGEREDGRGVRRREREKRELVLPEGDVKRERRERDGGKEKDKDADVVVVDASVLIHCLGHLKKWCRDDREEVVIVPLEALNTLDLLKKGTTTLAQRARAASRILEAQVGTNPRIKVQRDDAFVLWDEINFSYNAGSDPEGDKDKEAEAKKSENDKDVGKEIVMSSPEWVRRTICCARWEVDHSSGAPGTQNHAPDATPTPESRKNRTVILAVLASSPPPSVLPPANSATPANADSKTNTPPFLPVPLPLQPPPPNKYEPRSSGTLVCYWGRKAGMDVLEVRGGAAEGPGGREDDDRDGAGAGAGGRKRGAGHFHGGGGGRGRRNSHESRERDRDRERERCGARPGTGAGPGIVINAGGGKNGGGVRPGSGGVGGGGGGSVNGGGGLVERPPAVMAMMEMIGQPGKGGTGRVVRVLARGEKLDPDEP